MKFGSGNYSRSTSIGILGPTPLTDTILLPSMIPKDYMHLVAGGHMKWLMGRWDHMFTRDVFDAGSEYLSTIILPHSFKYQPWPLFQYSSWKTKYFRDLLLYISPVFAILFIPDRYAAHFLLYFLYIRSLHFFRDKSSLVGIDLLFNQYSEAIESLYGPRASLCSLHMHQHLLEQVDQHGSLSMTSCFARESSLGSSIKLCHGTRYALQQLVTWNNVDQNIHPNNNLTLSDIFTNEKLFDNLYVDQQISCQYSADFESCLNHGGLDSNSSIDFYARFQRGLSVFHSKSYIRHGQAISCFVAMENKDCSFDPQLCFAEVLFYVMINSLQYAFVKIHRCRNRSLTGRLSVSLEIKNRIDSFFRFYDQRQYFFDVVNVSCIRYKVIRLPFADENVFCFTPVLFDCEHD